MPTNEVTRLEQEEGPARCCRGRDLLISTAHSAPDLDAVDALLACSSPLEGTAAPSRTVARHREPGRGSRVLLARCGPEPVGAARISWGVARRAGEVRRARLTHLYVVPEARGAGVGEALVRKAAVTAWWSGCHDLRIAAEGLPPALERLLERAGFAPVPGDGPDGTPETGVAGHDLVLVVAPGVAP